ncbi:MAG: hypothetical protein OXE94_03580 [Aestuariivita sp.]|nr:hypothetical protein [Aestuariivita sp.]MCY4201588.1 hypothetical protein [Aestuariivita sp.]
MPFNSANTDKIEITLSAKTNTEPMQAPTEQVTPREKALGDLIKSKKHVADHGEVSTPPWLVEKMLDSEKGETKRIDSRFLEPHCGSANFS